MNILGKIKLLSDAYNIITDNLYKDEEKTQPITDIEGTTALLTTDGTSWEFSNGAWEQIDTDIDAKVLNSIYSFFMSVSNSIYNDFVKCFASKFYEDVTVSKNAETDYYIDLSIGETPLVKEGDFIIIASCCNKYLTMVKKVENNIITVDNRGLDMRFRDTEPSLGIFLVCYPPDYFQAVLEMFAYDLFKREDKEKRQERLGNYTYTNFEPVSYYGSGSYPKELQDTVLYWQHVFV